MNRLKQTNLIAQQIGFLLFGILLILIFSLCNLKYGAINYNLSDISAAILNSRVMTTATINIIQVRLPIILMAIMAGAGLALSGLLLQRVLQNPLACPSLVGIEYGTAFSVILAYLFIPNATLPVIILLAIGGSLLTYLVMQLIVKKMEVSTVGVTLVGVAFNTLYYSAIQATLLAFPYQAQALLYDLNGSLQGISLNDIKLIFIPFLILLCATLLCAKRLDFFDLDENQATTLGISIKKYKLIALGLALFMATLLTSVTGPFLFFGLIIPHLVKPFVRGAFTTLFCAIYGAVFLLAAELISRLLAPETPPPVGIVMLLMAAPILIFILRRYINHADY